MSLSFCVLASGSSGNCTLLICEGSGQRQCVLIDAGLSPRQTAKRLRPLGLNVRDLSDDFIERYLVAEWPEVGQCVGVFRIESLGVQLFESIEGDMFTVLGMPLLQVLGALRELEELPA